MKVSVDNGVTYVSADNHGDGTWTLAISKELAEGVYDVKVTAENAIGKVGLDTTIDELTVSKSLSPVTVEGTEGDDEFVFHAGDYQEARIAQRYDEYANAAETGT